MWKDLNKIWQKTFSLAWESYKCNTIPIGAVIVDEEQNIVALGRNMILDKTSTNPLAGSYMAHAEMTALMLLKFAEHPNVSSYTLYSTMEPCPMCFGTIVMMGIRNLKFAAWDGFAGATKLNDKLPYIQRKQINIEKGAVELGVFQIALQSVFELERKHRRIEEILASWAEDCSAGVILARELFEDNYFKNALEENWDISAIYDGVILRYGECSDRLVNL